MCVIQLILYHSNLILVDDIRPIFFFFQLLIILLLLDFKRCLYNYCDTHEKSTVGSIVAKGCKAAAKMLFTGTITLGCRSYLDSQERACYCGSSSKSDPNYKKSKYKGKYQDRSKEQPPPPGWRQDL